MTTRSALPERRGKSTTNANRHARGAAGAPPQAPLRPASYYAMSVTDDSGAPFFHRGDVILVAALPAIEAGFGSLEPGDAVVLSRKAACYGDGEFRRVVRVKPPRVTVEPFNERRNTTTIHENDFRVLGRVVLRWCSHGERPMREVRHG